MFPALRRVLVAVLALAMTMTLTGSAASAAPAFRDKPVATRPNPDVVMRGSGWGHGVGMSQYGAFAQSQAGWGFRRILQHYYTGITIGDTTLPSTIKIGLSTSLPYSNVDAVTGDIPWRARVDGKWVTKIQNKGTTWKVDVNENGLYRLWRGSTLKWKVKAPRLLANFNWRKSSSGTVVEAYNSNYPYRALYKWGRLEYVANANETLNMVVEIPSMELYLRGLAESISSWGNNGGMAALRAQAVVGRSYALHLRQTYEANCRCHMIATPSHQTYKGYSHESAGAGDRWVKAVNDTRGLVAKYNGAPIEAFYSSSHGGRSENIEDSWAYSAAYGYVRSVKDPWSLKASSGNPLASWDKRVSNSSFANFLRTDIRKVRRIKITRRSEGGTPGTLLVNGLNGTGTPVSRSRAGYVSRNNHGLVGNDLRAAYSFSGHVNLTTLPSSQIRRVGFVPFSDDDGSVHEYAIVFAHRAGIMEPRSATRFAPRGTVTRAKLAQYLYKTLRLPAATKDYYRDDNGMLEEPAINALAQARIARGISSGQFYPRHALTRGEAATFFKRALGLRVPDHDYFTDDNSSPHENAINAMRRKRLMTGCGPQKFCPNRDMRRGAMATLLLKTVDAYR